MMVLKALVLLAVCCCCVDSYCNDTYIKAIKRFWGKKPIRVDLNQLVGTITYLWISPSYSEGQNIKCLQTTLAKPGMRAKDYTEHVDGSTTITDEYFYILELPGVITLTSYNSPDDWLHVVYFNTKEKVFAVYQCDPTANNYEPYVYVAAVNYNRNNSTTGEVRRALAVLNKIGINDAKSIPTKCTTFIRKST